MTAPLPREDRPGAAVMIMAAAVFLFTLIDTSAKWLSLAGLPVLQIGVFALCWGVCDMPDRLCAQRRRSPVPLKQAVDSAASGLVPAGQYNFQLLCVVLPSNHADDRDVLCDPDRDDAAQHSDTG